MNVLIFFAVLAVAHAAPRSIQQVNDIPEIPIPYDILRRALQEKENNVFNTIQVKDINELRGVPFDDTEESNFGKDTFDNLTPDDIQTAINIASALEFIILRDIPNKDTAYENADGVNSLVKEVYSVEEPDNEEESNADVQSNIVDANDQSRVRIVNVAANELESPRIPQMRVFN